MDLYFFQWKRNPYYRETTVGAKWYSFTEPLQDLLPNFFLLYVNQLLIVSGLPYLYNGTILCLSNRLGSDSVFFIVPPIDPVNDPLGQQFGYQNLKVDLYATLPLIPTDTACLK